LLFFDNFNAQCTEAILKYLDSNNINVVLIPPNCTGRLQPLDLSVNKSAKEFLRNEFQEWYAQQVCAQLQEKANKQAVDLRLSVVKPLGAKWMVNFYNYMQKTLILFRMGSGKLAFLVNLSECNYYTLHT